MLFILSNHLIISNMNAKKILLMAAVAVGLVSCNTWDDSFHGLPDYSHYKTGTYEVSVDSSSVKETKFEYVSWIEAPTKPYRQEITLTASIENTEGEIKILGDFNFGEGKSYVVREGRGFNKRRDVTIVDSMFIYRVILGEIVIDYEMPFQAALYNDDNTAGQMAYIGFGNVVDKGYTLTSMSPEVVDGSVYQRQLLRHAITVDFGGKSYPATATVIVKKKVGFEGDEYLVSSRLLGQGITDVESDGHYASYRSWIEVEQVYNTGKKENMKYDLLLYAELKMKSISDMDFVGADLQKTSAGFDESKEHLIKLPKAEYVYAYYYEKYYVVNYNYGYTETVFYDVDVVYNDGYNTFNFPTLHYSNIQDEGSVERVGGGEDAHGKYGEYKFTQRVSAQLNDVQHSVEKSHNFVLLEK